MTTTKIESSWVAGDRYTIDVRGHHLLVDQPVDLGGEDLAPTPIELFVASLGACIAYYGGRFLARHGIDRTGLRVVTEFELTTAPNRVGTIHVEVVPPENMPENLRPALRAVVSRCTVHNSLEFKPQVTIHVAEHGAPR